ncbi:MAG: hypothetical protein JST17_10740 [Bacteroidetes bacterium]|nr:hypothetical protein [Bacteroidota bacterium]MBS1930372.1 hypothetical protein [Bacteroidota bacterium]
MFLLIACNQAKEKTENTSKQKDDMNALYEKNLADLQVGISAFEKGDLDAWSASVADSAQWESPAYGDTVHTKAQWREPLKFYIDKKYNSRTILIKGWFFF